MSSELDIENTGALLAYLRETGRLGATETAVCRALSGGVSNRTVLVQRANGTSWVLKQALAKLRVKEDWFSDPARVRHEAQALSWLGELAPPGSVPALLFEDPSRHLLAMEAVPAPHENWKERLLAGHVEGELVEAFARWLGVVHRRSHERQAGLAPVFADRSFFQSLRLEPYYRFTAVRQPGAAAFLDSLIAETLGVRCALVHGDYSPKNVLVHRGRPVVLDHEVSHFGDPAFDLGFALTHLLSKAHHLPRHRAAFLEAAGRFWQAYLDEVTPGTFARFADLEGRATRHTLACLLARVEGRSPLEYLDDAERARQRSIVLALMREPPRELSRLIAVFGERLDAPEG